MTWWVYLLRCADGTLYCGIALDVEARLNLHQAGKGAKYTRGRGPLELVYREVCGSKAEALRRERALKRLKRPAKEALISAAVTGRP
ncbi:GIY-YIG nuclease family protein [Geothrix fuzhouensis]|uniref:GIY-YIG nuclease family protein n=1 Tax=Geothrix fuzhouensis TaxID=2966451 RepID=UPI00214869F2|nr:GIY-YIG nuclease family protein [Geothrix fuzhouensis]